jgi:hypothetical protein
MNTARQESKLIAPKMAITEESVRLPNRLLILPWGESSYDGGTHKLIVNEAAISRIKEAQAASNFDKLALDFNHNSIPGSESYSGEPVKVAAYGVLEIVPNVGIYLANLEWTEDGINAWRGRHYKDISPAVLPDDTGVVCFIHSAALCRNGRLPGLEAFNADFLKLKPKVKMDKYKQMVCKLLGLVDGSDDAAIDAAFEKASLAQPCKKDVDGKVKELEDKLETFSARFKQIEDSIGGIKKSLDDNARESVMASALAAGKIVPEDAKKLDTEALKLFCAGLPSVVPVGRRTPDGIREFSANIPNNPVVSDVCKNLGLTEDEFKKGE